MVSHINYLLHFVNGKMVTLAEVSTHIIKIVIGQSLLSLPSKGPKQQPRPIAVSFSADTLPVFSGNLLINTALVTTCSIVQDTPGDISP